MWLLMKWWSDMTMFFSFGLNSHIMRITDGAMWKYFDVSTHMPKSKSWETHWVCFSCINTFYPPTAYSPLNRYTVSNWFKSLLFDVHHLRIHSNCALVSMACKFNSNINKVLTNYYSFTSINTNSIKHTTSTSHRYYIKMQATRSRGRVPIKWTKTYMIENGIDTQTSMPNTLQQKRMSGKVPANHH